MGCVKQTNRNGIIRGSLMWKFALPVALLAIVSIKVRSAPSEVNPAKLQAIASKIDTVLTTKTLRTAGVGIFVRDLATGKVIYSHNPDKKLIPASNMKIITAATALEFLKPEYRFKTEVYVDVPQKNGIVEGNIFIKGYGDPLLVDENLWAIARDVAYGGISKITGNVYADDLYFDDGRYGKGWKAGWESYYAPSGALSLNFNTFVVTVVPAAKAGSPPKVFLMPPNRHLEVVNRARTVSSGRARIEVVKTPEKVNSYSVIGQISVGNGPETVRRSIGDPGLYTAGSFEAYLSSWGVATSGKIGRKDVPENARLIISYESPPLSRVIMSMGKVSNNFVSEQILKTLGAEYTPEGKPKKGSSEMGIRVVAGYLKKLGIKPGTYVIADGSGLSRLNRVTASQINTVLVRMYRMPYYRPEFIASLGVGGVDGTIEDRFRKEPLKRRVRAKTGHLNGVNTLSGYLLTDSGRTLAFSILVNNFNGYHSSVERLQEKILLALNGY